MTDMPESPDPIDVTLVAGLWQVVARHGWDGLTLARVAAAAEVPVGLVRRRCPTPLRLLCLHGLVADQMVLAGTVPGQGGAVRDRLFDVLMRRIDVMQAHRAGVLRLFEDLRRDPLAAVALLGAVPRSMAWMLEAAEVPVPRGALGALRVKGLTAVWLATVRAWAKDDGADLGATMAALDRALDRAGQAARSLRIDMEG